MASMTLVVMDTCGAANVVLCYLDQNLAELEVDKETISIIRNKYTISYTLLLLLLLAIG